MITKSQLTNLIDIAESAVRHIANFQYLIGSELNLARYLVEGGFLMKEFVDALEKEAKRYDNTPEK